MASTAQEALIAELLGDIGRLHDEIKALPGALGPALAAIGQAQGEALALIERSAAAHAERLAAQPGPPAGSDNRRAPITALLDRQQATIERLETAVGQLAAAVNRGKAPVPRQRGLSWPAVMALILVLGVVLSLPCCSGN